MAKSRNRSRDIRKRAAKKRAKAAQIKRDAGFNSMLNTIEKELGISKLLNVKVNPLLDELTPSHNAVITKIEEPNA